MSCDKNIPPLRFSSEASGGSNPPPINRAKSFTDYNGRKIFHSGEHPLPQNNEFSDLQNLRRPRSQSAIIPFKVPAIKIPFSPIPHVSSPLRKKLCQEIKTGSPQQIIRNIDNEFKKALAGDPSVASFNWSSVSTSRNCVIMLQPTYLAKEELDSLTTGVLAEIIEGVFFQDYRGTPPASDEVIIEQYNKFVDHLEKKNYHFMEALEAYKREKQTPELLPYLSKLYDELYAIRPFSLVGVRIQYKKSHLTSKLNILIAAAKDQGMKDKLLKALRCLIPIGGDYISAEDTSKVFKDLPNSDVASIGIQPEFVSTAEVYLKNGQRHSVQLMLNKAIAESRKTPPHALSAKSGDDSEIHRSEPYRMIAANKILDILGLSQNLVPKVETILKSSSIGSNKKQEVVVGPWIREKEEPPLKSLFDAYCEKRLEAITSFAVGRDCKLLELNQLRNQLMELPGQDSFEALFLGDLIIGEGDKTYNQIIFDGTKWMAFDVERWGLPSEVVIKDGKHYVVFRSFLSELPHQSYEISSKLKRIIQGWNLEEIKKQLEGDIGKAEDFEENALKIDSIQKEMEEINSCKRHKDLEKRALAHQIKGCESMQREVLRQLLISKLNQQVSEIKKNFQYKIHPLFAERMMNFLGKVQEKVSTKTDITMQHIFELAFPELQPILKVLRHLTPYPFNAICFGLDEEGAPIKTPLEELIESAKAKYQEALIKPILAKAAHLKTKIIETKNEFNKTKSREQLSKLEETIEKAEKALGNKEAKIFKLTKDIREMEEAFDRLKEKAFPYRLMPLFFDIDLTEKYQDV